LNPASGRSLVDGVREKPCILSEQIMTAPRIISITRVKNEIDIIEAFVRHHSHHVDHMIVEDDDSTDGSYEVLCSLRDSGFPLSIERKSSVDYAQSRLMTALLKEAVDHLSADWIVPLDADEFIEPEEGTSLGVILQQGPPRPLSVRWSNFVWSDDSDQTEEANPVVRLQFRMPPREDLTKVIVPSALVANREVILWQGNHGITCDGEPQFTERCDRLALCHFPIRNVSQYASKVAVGYLKYAAMADRAEGQGFHYSEPFSLLTKNLASFAEGMPAQSRRYSAPNDLVIDDEPVRKPLRYEGGALSLTRSEDDRFVSNILLYAETLGKQLVEEIRRRRLASEA
jgi:hypothetical protein